VNPDTVNRNIQRRSRMLSSLFPGPVKVRQKPEVLLEMCRVVHLLVTPEFFKRIEDFQIQSPKMAAIPGYDG